MKSTCKPINFVKENSESLLVKIIDKQVDIVLIYTLEQDLMLDSLHRDRLLMSGALRKLI